MRTCPSAWNARIAPASRARGASSGGRRMAASLPRPRAAVLSPGAEVPPMKLAASLVLLALLSFARPAAALDLCYVESTTGHTYGFHKVKLPKRAGDSVPMTGVQDGTIGVFGTLYVIGDDLYLEGIANKCFVSAAFDSALDALVTFNCAPIGGGVTGYTWTRTGC